MATEGVTMLVTEDIVTIADLKNDAAGVVRQLNTTHRPMIVTQRGKAAMVLLAPAEYDRLVYVRDVVQGLSLAMAEADAGILTPHEAVVPAIRTAVEDAVPAVATSRRTREGER